MSCTILKRLLDEKRVAYMSIQHPPSYTSQETAASAHVPGREMAKTVMVMLDGTLAMAVLPAPRRIDLELLKQVTGAKTVSMASEATFKERFPDCEVGAMPPFGNLYGLEVYVDESLRADEKICFNAGTHHELIQMDYGDFEELVDPMITMLAYRRKTYV